MDGELYIRQFLNREKYTRAYPKALDSEDLKTSIFLFAEKYSFRISGAQICRKRCCEEFKHKMNVKQKCNHWAYQFLRLTFSREFSLIFVHSREN